MDIKRYIAAALLIVSRLAIVLGVLVAGYAGYHLAREFWWPVTFVEVAKERTKLIDGLESYQSIEEAKSWFAARSFKWELVADNHLAPGDKRPPMSIYSVSIKNYVHLECSGELHVSFFNNRLMSAIFYPVEHDRYLDRLVKREGIRFVVDSKRPDVREATVAPHTRVWPYRDYQGRSYVGWSDTRLEEEEMLWTMRYA
jgi:hypothetical protein